MGKETRPTLMFGKMPDLMDLDEGVAVFYRFDQLGGAPRYRVASDQRPSDGSSQCDVA